MSSFSPKGVLRNPISGGRASFRMRRPGVVSIQAPSFRTFTFAW